jgi:hypothetical protein
VIARRPLTAGRDVACVTELCRGEHPTEDGPYAKKFDDFSRQPTDSEPPVWGVTDPDLLRGSVQSEANHRLRTCPQYGDVVPGGAE